MSNSSLLTITVEDMVVIEAALKSCQKKQIIRECAPSENYKTFDSALVDSALSMVSPVLDQYLIAR